MCSALSKFTSNHIHEFNEPAPQPGEIWQLSTMPHYVMIVKDDRQMKIVSVMVLSFETSFVSDVDLVVSVNISGLEQDLLAQTWLVLEIQTSDLLRQVGKRISRQVYDLLLNVGDHYHGLLEKAPKKFEIEQLGLKVGTRKAEENREIQVFHAQQEAWSNLLNLNQAEGIKFAERILNEALEVEQLAKVTQKPQVFLGKWLQNSFEADWKIFLPTSQLALATRGIDIHQVSSLDEITVLLAQMLTLKDEYQRRRVIRRLSEIAVGNSDVIQALVNLIHKTQDDETLWAAVESLWQIDPGNTNVGAKRMKLIDLGMQVAGEAVALAAAVVPTGIRQVGVLLQVYPTGSEIYLPPGLKLILLDESGKIFWEVTARVADVYLQLKLRGKPGEKFSARVSLAEAAITEDFVI